jgi:tripartite ATP-independent transporter DctM subunit
VVLGLLYIILILLIGFTKPEALPLAKDRRPLTGSVVFDVFKTVFPTFFLIFITLGSIFGGIATPTEASGVGALGSTLLALWNKRLTFGVIRKVTYDTFKTCGFVFGIFVGATAFALVLRLLGGDELIQGLIKAIPLGPYGIVCIILFAIFIMGFFLDWIEICLIMLPLLAPVINDIGLKFSGYPGIDKPELVWFTILVAVTLQTSFLTPPVGFSIFFLQGVMPPSCALLDIYKGVFPFVIVQIIGILLPIFFPQMVLWLPMVAYGK